MLPSWNGSLFPFANVTAGYIANPVEERGHCGPAPINVKFGFFRGRLLISGDWAESQPSENTRLVSVQTAAPARQRQWQLVMGMFNCVLKGVNHECAL